MFVRRLKLRHLTSTCPTFLKLTLTHLQLQVRVKLKNILTEPLPSQHYKIKLHKQKEILVERASEHNCCINVLFYFEYMKNRQHYLCCLTYFCPFFLTVLMRTKVFPVVMTTTKHQYASFVSHLSETLQNAANSSQKAINEEEI